MTMTGFWTFCLFGGGNPANKLAGEIKDWQPNYWAANSSYELGWKWFEDHFQDNAQAWQTWAVVESLNEGSLNRAGHPELPIKGSGRWGASDSGGHWSLLKDSILRWMDIEKEERRKWARLGQVLERMSGSGLDEALQVYVDLEDLFRDCWVRLAGEKEPRRLWALLHREVWGENLGRAIAAARRWADNEFQGNLEFRVEVEQDSDVLEIEYVGHATY